MCKRASKIVLQSRQTQFICLKVPAEHRIIHISRVCHQAECMLTDRNFVDNFLQVAIYLALVANI